MREYLKFYIDGQWVDPLRPNTFDVENPVTENGMGIMPFNGIIIRPHAGLRPLGGWIAAAPTPI